MSADNPRPTKVTAWIALFRPPNLLTVPGDPLAGALLAAGTLGIAPDWPAVTSVAGSALALYASGLVSNDVFDHATDARERPDRPIPSGAVRPGTALPLALFATALGIAAATGAGYVAAALSCILAATVWLYNGIGKRFPLLAPFNMGACRGLSILMGAAVFGVAGLSALPVLIAAAAQTLYVAGLTFTARREAEAVVETGHWVPGWIAPMLPLILAIGFSVPFLAHPSRFNLAAGLALMSIAWAGLWSVTAVRANTARGVQGAVGGLIRGLILTQAAWCAFSGPAGQEIALLVLAAFPVAGWLGRRFYGS